MSTHGTDGRPRRGRPRDLAGRWWSWSWSPRSAPCSRNRSSACTYVLVRRARPRRRRSSSASSSSGGSCRRSSSTAWARSSIGLLQAHRRFAAPMFAPILNNLVVIGTFFAYATVRGEPTARVVGITDLEQTILAVGTTLGVVAMTVALWPSLRSIGYRLRLRFDWRHEAVRQLVRLAAWVVALRRRQPARVRGRDRAQQPVRRRTADLHHRLHRVPAPPRDLRRLDLHRAAAEHERTVGDRRRRRRPRARSPVDSATPPS